MQMHGRHVQALPHQGAGMLTGDPVTAPVAASTDTEKSALVVVGFLRATSLYKPGGTVENEKFDETDALTFT